MSKFKFLSSTLLLISLAFVAHAQERLSIRLSKAPLSALIKAIEAESDYTFFINDSKVNAGVVVSIDQQNSTVDQVLKAALSNTTYSYQIVGKQIVLTSSPNLKSSATNSQRRQVTGTVKDVNGTPLRGVTVSVLRQSSSTSTDSNGKYILDIPSSSTQLQFAFLGYSDRLVNIVDKSNYDVVLDENTTLMDEVVVIGYGAQSKKDLTGAVSVVKMDDIESGTQSTISHSLAGKAAGLRVNRTSAQAGGGANFRIRGQASINASNDPLIVIDGFPVSSGGSLDGGNIYQSGSTDNVLESINPDDIESISVLKDAASTAIYGARAGHGVIIINTKRGKNQKAKVDYSGNYSAQRMSNNFDMLQVDAYMDMRNKQLYEEYLKVNGLGIYSDYISLPNDHVVAAFTPMYTNDQIHQAVGTNWLDNVTRNGFMTQHNLSINGGGASTRFLTSFNFMRQEGIVRNNNANRFTTRLNLDQDLSRIFTLGITANYSKNKYDNVPLGDGQNEYSGVLTSAIQANPAIPIFDAIGNYYIDPYRPFVPNPVSLLDILDKTDKDRLLASGYLSAKPITGLELKLKIGADRKIQKRSNYLPKTTLEGQKHNGSANISQEDATDYLLALTADYGLSIGDHKLKSLVGYSYQQFNGAGVTAGNRDFLTDGFLYHNIGAGTYEKPIVGSWAWKNSIASYFLRMHYDYKGKYFLEGTLRADGASNFTPENRWGYFPSLSAAWTISEESFMQSSKGWLNVAKLRASFGQTGNSSVGYRIQDFFSVGRNAIFGETQVENPGVFASEIGNPSLTWETTRELNLGLDLAFFNNRVNLTTEVFDRKISDLLSTKILMSYFEVPTVAANIGATKSSGVEVTLNTNNIQKEHLSWNTTFTLSHYYDRWAERDPDWKPSSYQKFNDPIRAWWSYEAVGIMQPGATAPAAQADLLPGMMILKDQNGDNNINNDDMVYVDNGDPKLIMGFNNSLKFKRFDFNIYFYGETGRKRGASYKQTWTRMDNGQNVSQMSYEAFSSSNLESPHPTYLRGGYGWGDYYVKSINFIRCGNINLGYSLPNVGKVARNLRIFVDVTNPFVLTNWTGIDPETDNQEFPYPNIRSYNFGLNLSL